MGVSLGDIAANFGKGLFAGLAGTAAMTVSSTLEMKLSGRGASQTPAEAAEAVLDVEPKDEESEGRFSNLVHWGYGLGRRAGSSGVDRTLRSVGHRGAPGVGVGRRAGRLASARRLGPGVQVRRKGDRNRSTPPRRLCHGHRDRLLLPGPEPVSLASGSRSATGQRRQEALCLILERVDGRAKLTNEH